MAPSLPKLSALIVNSYGLFIFRNPTNVVVHVHSTLIPSLIFALSIYAFTLDVSYFKVGFRKIFVPCQFVLEFLATIFILEMALLDFWFPLEKFVLSQMMAAADLLKQYHCLGLNTTLCCYMYSALRSPMSAIASSYCLSCFFLGCTMQGTNIIDFRIMRYRCGVDVFIQSLIKRTRKGVYNCWPYKGIKPSCPGRYSRRWEEVDSETYIRRRR